MAGYLISVHWTDGNTSIQHSALWGVADGIYPDQTTAISQTENAVTAYATAKGEAVINMTALVSATR